MGVWTRDKLSVRPKMTASQALKQSASINNITIEALKYKTYDPYLTY